MATHAKLQAAGISCILIQEPDPPFNGDATAIGCFPIPRKNIKRLLADLPLLWKPKRV